MRKVLIITRSPSLWTSLLEDYFSEVDVEKISETETLPQGLDMIFVEAAFCVSGLISKMRVAKSLNPLLRLFSLGEPTQECKGLFDCVFPEACNLFDLTKKISEKLPTADSIRLLVADDDPDIRAMVCDYFDGRHAPKFEVLRAANGREAMEWVEKKRPDAMILDVKMPLMTGSEVYCKLQKKNEKIPTIIFFDAISASDLDAIKKTGRPVIVEKGYRDSSMANLMATVKKLIYFST